MADEPVVPLVVPPAPKPETFSREYVQELRHESASYRTKATDAEKKASDAEALAKKATDEADGKIKEAKSAADQRIIRAELKAEALKAGMVDLDGLKLADLSKVKLNETTGEVEGAEALMTELKKAKPFLFGKPGSTSHTEEKPPKPGDPEIKNATKMTDAEYKQARKDIAAGKIPAVKV